MNSLKFRELLDLTACSNDNFIRITDELHKKADSAAFVGKASSYKSCSVRRLVIC